MKKVGNRMARNIDVHCHCVHVYIIIPVCTARVYIDSQVIGVSVVITKYSERSISRNNNGTKES